MKRYVKWNDVPPDRGMQKCCSCVANGKIYDESEIAILASVIKGVAITEISIPEQVAKLWLEYATIAGDPFDLRNG